MDKIQDQSASTYILDNLSALILATSIYQVAPFSKICQNILPEIMAYVEIGLDSTNPTQVTVMPPAKSRHTTPATDVTPDINMPNPPSKFECMSSSEILSQLHHPNSCLQLVCPCNTPNASKSKTTYNP
jgi:hypothetical protein